MNEDTVKGNWKQFKGKMIEQWGKLTNDDFDTMVWDVATIDWPSGAINEIGTTFMNN